MQIYSSVYAVLCVWVWERETPYLQPNKNAIGSLRLTNELYILKVSLYVNEVCTTKVWNTVRETVLEKRKMLWLANEEKTLAFILRDQKGE